MLALRAIWRAFQGEERLRFEGEFYSFSLLTDFFSPGPSDHPAIPIAVAGVNAGMARLAGEVCDGFHAHPFHSPRYLREVIVPAIAEGADTAGRSADACEIYCPVFVIVGDSEPERASQRESVRRQLSFYGSTRTYRPVFELHGWGEVSEQLHRSMAAGDTEAIARAITDEMLEEYAVTATWDGLAAALVDRYRGVADRVFGYGPAQEWIDIPHVAERWQAVAAAVPRRPLTRAWAVACPSVGGARATAGPYRRHMAVIPRIEDLADPTFDPYLSDEAVFGSVPDPYPRIAELRAEAPVHSGRLPRRHGHPFTRW